MVDFKKMLAEINEEEFWKNIMGGYTTDNILNFNDWYKASSKWNK